MIDDRKSDSASRRAVQGQGPSDGPKRAQVGPSLLQGGRGSGGPEAEAWLSPESDDHARSGPGAAPGDSRAARAFFYVPFMRFIWQT